MVSTRPGERADPLNGPMRLATAAAVVAAAVATAAVAAAAPHVGAGCARIVHHGCSRIVDDGTVLDRYVQISVEVIGHGDPDVIELAW